MRRPAPREGKRETWHAPRLWGYRFSVPTDVMQHPWDPFPSSLKFAPKHGGELLDIGPGDIVDLYSAKGDHLMVRVRATNLGRTGRTADLELCAVMVDYGRRRRDDVECNLVESPP